MKDGKNTREILKLYLRTNHNACLYGNNINNNSIIRIRALCSTYPFAEFDHPTGALQRLFAGREKSEKKSYVYFRTLYAYIRACRKITHLVRYVGRPQLQVLQLVGYDGRHRVGETRSVLGGRRRRKTSGR